MRWKSDTAMVIEPPRGVQWFLVLLRCAVFLFVSLANLFFLAVLFLVSCVTGRTRAGEGIVRYWAQIGLWCCGLTVQVEGEPMAQRGAIVANHSSWIDIFTLHAVAHVVFVSKDEVGSWPFIGLLARATRTIFIERRQNAAKDQQQMLASRIAAGDRLCIFPEGTSTDGTLVLDFKSSLFGALHQQTAGADVWVQPVSVVYLPRAELPRRFYGWWGDMEFSEHMLAVFGRSRGGRVKVVLHPPVEAGGFESRKLLAAWCGKTVREGFDAVVAEELLSDGGASAVASE